MYMPTIKINKITCFTLVCLNSFSGIYFHGEPHDISVPDTINFALRQPNTDFDSVEIGNNVATLRGFFALFSPNCNMLVKHFTLYVFLFQTYEKSNNVF